MSSRWSGSVLGPSWSGLRKAATDDPRDTSEAIRELATWLPGDTLRDATWAAEMESRWNPHAENPIGAVGLFQFLPSTCKLLQTDASTVRGQGRADQARLLARLWARRPPRPRDFYVRLFWPAGEGRADSYVIAEKGSKVWQQNPGLRGPGDGPITVGRVRELGRPPKDWPSSAELRDWATKGHASPRSSGSALVLVVLGTAWYLSHGRSLRLFGRRRLSASGVNVVKCRRVAGGVSTSRSTTELGRVHSQKRPKHALSTKKSCQRCQEKLWAGPSGQWTPPLARTPPSREIVTTGVC